MPRYYFDVENGDVTYVDDSGLVLQDDDAAIEEAFQSLLEITRMEDKNLTIIVRAGHDRSIARLSLSILDGYQPVE